MQYAILMLNYIILYILLMLFEGIILYSIIWYNTAHVICCSNVILSSHVIFCNRVCNTIIPSYAIGSPDYIFNGYVIGSSHDLCWRNNIASYHAVCCNRVCNAIIHSYATGSSHVICCSIVTLYSAQWGSTIKSSWVRTFTSRYPSWYDLRCC